MEFRPIGVIRSPFKDPADTPISTRHGQGVRGTVEVFPEFAEGLRDLDGFSHIALLFHIHRAREGKLTVVPFGETEPRGVFATRSPRRPNPIGLSVVRLLGINGNVLEIENIDILDGTPLLDIKPYIPESDEEEAVRLGWLERARRGDGDRRSDGDPR